MLDKIKFEVISIISKVQIRTEEIDQLEQQQHAPADVNYEHAEAGAMHSDDAKQKEDKHQPYVRNDKKIGRNDPCYCGSGKKYKQCHGKLS